ncbi:MAG: hypothetical protein GC191_06265 [Azospirillum sp.]|nr:hypothetical protein [Azospirillum sp.]
MTVVTLERLETTSPSDWSLAPVVEWLFRSGRLIRDPIEMLEALGRTLIDAGSPVQRIRFSVRTLHPQLRGWGVSWSQAAGKASLSAFHYGVENTRTYLGSPVQAVFESGQKFRRRLIQLDGDADHIVLHELAAEGYTDYLALPLVFSTGTVNTLIFATQASGGFVDPDVDRLERLSEFVTPVLEVAGLRRTAVSLLETYLGRRAGRRVLDGLIRRGDGERLSAVIWYSDLRDFTRHTETLPEQVMLSLLNDYFGSLTEAVTPHGGEVLDFIGDAMLIAFPQEEDGPDFAALCRGAVTAARDAFAAICAINQQRQAVGAPTIAFGVGLDAGEVIIGNVGAPDRLNFAVRGTPVNRAARIETLTKEVGHPLLLSRAVQEQLAAPAQFVGQFEVKGVSGALDVYALDVCSWEIGQPSV